MINEIIIIINVIIILRLRYARIVRREFQFINSSFMTFAQLITIVKIINKMLTQY